MHHSDADYRQTLDYLFSRLPMFSRIGAAAIKKDLGNTLALCAALGNPERQFRCVHVAGSNGKGSTSHLLAAIFQASGYNVGLYTSPHLVDFRERIRINGRPVAKDFVCDFVAQHQALIEQIAPSFFEITVAMAFTAFAAEKVDIAIIETGLGGRLDSTNVVLPELSVITNISLEHTDILGPTITAIAGEKAGIIKAGRSVVIGEFHPESLPVFQKKAEEMDAPLTAAWQRWQVRQEGSQFLAVPPKGKPTLGLECPLHGSYQQANIATVLTAIDVLREQGWQLPPQAVERGFREVVTLTGLRGRWDVWQQRPLIIADVAHNPGGLSQTMSDWEKVDAKQKHVLVGFVRDKDVKTALQFFAGAGALHFCAARVPRALPVEDLAAIANEQGLQGQIYPSVAEALEALLKTLSEDDALLITGSFFVVGEAMGAFYPDAVS